MHGWSMGTRLSTEVVLTDVSTRVLIKYKSQRSTSFPVSKYEDSSKAMGGYHSWPPCALYKYEWTVLSKRWILVILACLSVCYITVYQYLKKRLSPLQCLQQLCSVLSSKLLSQITLEEKLTLLCMFANLTANLYFR